MTATETKRAAPAETGTARRDTPRAMDTRHTQDSTLASTSVGVINWTETAGQQPLAHVSTPPVQDKKLTKRQAQVEAYLRTARVKRIGPGHYEAESGSRPGEWYTCRLVRGHLSCSCPATGACKHLSRVTPLLLADARLLELENREADAPTLLSAERLAAARLAVLRQESEYGEGWLSGGAL